MFTKILFFNYNRWVSQSYTHSTLTTNPQCNQGNLRMSKYVSSLLHGTWQNGREEIIYSSTTHWIKKTKQNKQTNKKTPTELVNASLLLRLSEIALRLTTTLYSQTMKVSFTATVGNYNITTYSPSVKEFHVLPLKLKQTLFSILWYICITLTLGKHY